MWLLYVGVQVLVGVGIIGPADHTSKLMCYVVNNLLCFVVMYCTGDLFGVLYIDFPCV